MNFKEQYALDNEKLHTNTDLDKVLAKQKQEERKRVLTKKIVKFGSIAACFVLCGAALFTTLKNRSGVDGKLALMTESNDDIRAEAVLTTDSEVMRSDVDDQLQSTNSFQSEEETAAFVPDADLEMNQQVQESATVTQNTEGKVHKEILLLIPLFLLIIVMIAWALFKK